MEYALRARPPGVLAAALQNARCGQRRGVDADRLRVCDRRRAPRGAKHRGKSRIAAYIPASANTSNITTIPAVIAGVRSTVTTISGVVTATRCRVRDRQWIRGPRIYRDQRHSRLWHIRLHLNRGPIESLRHLPKCRSPTLERHDLVARISR